MHIAAIGIGAGLVSALLFAVVITGSPLAMLLSFVAPLPIFIASLGWNHRCGLLAALTGAAALALGISATAGLAFAIGWALPSWWLAYLALLGRPVGPGTMEWYPTGRLLLWIAICAALITVLGILSLGDGSYEAYKTNVHEAFSGYLESREPQASADVPGASEIVRYLVGGLPLLFAFNFVMVLALNLWLAAKSVKVSGRLPRPWPEIPSTIMPLTAPVQFAAALAVAFAPGIVGAAGRAVLGGLAAAFALQGLAFIHDASRGRAGRTFLLSTIYMLAFLASTISLPLLALLGIADVAVGLRSRFGLGKAGPGSRST
jgi:hypothetical protein